MDAYRVGTRFIWEWLWPRRRQGGPAGKRLALLARSVLTGRAFLASIGFAGADLLFDLLSLDRMFVAVRYHPGFGPLAVAYAAASIASALPITAAGWAWPRSRWWPSPSGFGAPRPTAILAGLGYRHVNYWLPLPPPRAVANLLAYG